MTSSYFHENHLITVVIFLFETYAIALSNEQRILICYEPVYLFTLTLVILIDG